MVLVGTCKVKLYSLSLSISIPLYECKIRNSKKNSVNKLDKNHLHIFFCEQYHREEKPLLFYNAEWNRDIKLVCTDYGKGPSRRIARRRL